MIRSVYLNGQIVPVDQATVSVYDGGWLHGAGLFETMRAEGRCVFRLQNHYDRLRRSAEKLLLPVDQTLLPGQSAIERLLDCHGLDRARLRLTVTVGCVLSGAEPESTGLTICLTAAAIGGSLAEQFERGFRVQIARYRQSQNDPLAGHKSTNYLPRLIALNEARRAGCEESLWFTPENSLAEGSISNVFVVKDGTVMTPPVSTPVLPGIARGVVLELCNAQNISREEHPMTIDDLLDADEVFLTNSILQVMPVTHVEKRVIATGKPGNVTRRLAEQFRYRVAAECQCHD